MGINSKHIYKKKRALAFAKARSLKKVAMTYSPTNICSTIGAVGLNFSVRNGKRWIPDAINRLNKCKKNINCAQNKEYLSYESANNHNLAI